jgi:H+/Cl- antiporter ClcA
MPRSFDHEHIRFWTHARRRRQSQLVLALIVGLAAGAVAVLFEHGLEYAESLRFTLLGALAGNPLRWFIVPLLCGIAGATARMITGAWAPEASGAASRTSRACFWGCGR